MRLMQWLREKLGLCPRDHAAEAIEAMDEATIRLRSVRQQLEPFRLEHDPFAAIMRKQIMTEPYESRQINNLHRGPRP